MNSWFIEQVKNSDIEYTDIAKTSVIFGVKLDDLFNKVQGLIVINSCDELDAVIGLANSQQIGLLPLYSKSQLKPEMIHSSKSELYLLDLSRLKHINHEKDVITIESGVTQRELFDYFKANDIKKMMPTAWIDHGGSIVEEVICKRNGIVKYDPITTLCGISATSGDGLKIEVNKSSIDGANGALMRDVALSKDLSIVKNISFLLMDECRSSSIVEINFKQKHLIKNVVNIDALKIQNKSLCGTMFLNEHAVNHLIYKKDIFCDTETKSKQIWTSYSFVTGTRNAVNSTIQDIDIASSKHVIGADSYLSINILAKLSRMIPLSLSKRIARISEFKLKLKTAMKGYTDCFKIEMDSNESNKSIINFNLRIENNGISLDETIKAVDRIKIKYKVIPLISIQSVGEGRCFEMNVVIAVENNFEGFEDRISEIKRDFDDLPYFTISSVIESMKGYSSNSIKERMKSSFDKRNVLQIMREEAIYQERDEDIPSWFTGNKSTKSDHEEMHHIE